jgi:hypothetical protein
MEESLMVPPSMLDSLPAMVRSELARMSAQKQSEFVEEYRRKAKSIGVAYVLWMLALHYAYLGKWGLQILFLFTVGGLFVWFFIDIFRMPKLVRDHNKDVATDVLRTMKAISG